jgi:two-component system cell cycle sensor histidine kinase PleC
LYSECETAGDSLKFEVEGYLPFVNVDPWRFRRILDCLISNAIKFNPKGTDITISAYRLADNGVAVVVADNGIGMNPEELALATLAFQQVDGRLSRAHEGAGLGLPIAKALIELHGGSLTLKSEKGAGTSVILNFPPQSSAGHLQKSMRISGT